MISEAMSCGAVVITTDCARMNELVTPERGELVRANRSEPMRLRIRCFADPADQVNRAIAMRPDERRALGENARRWYEAQRGSFACALTEFVSSIPT